MRVRDDPVFPVYPDRCRERVSLAPEDLIREP